MTMIKFGQVVTVEGIKNGQITTSKRRTIESLPIKDRKDMFDTILKQLDLDAECIEFRVYKDKYTHEPYRMEIESETNG